MKHMILHSLKPSTGGWLLLVASLALHNLAAQTKQATPADKLTVAPGFKVELIRSSEPGEGSWVSMTTDNKGRLIVSPQGPEALLRVTLDASGHIAKLEPLDTPMRGAMGMLYVSGNLYVNGRGPQGYHLYRLRDTDGDGHFGPPELLRQWNRGRGGDGEHGAHGILLGPDKKLYIICGNFVDVPEDILPSSPHKNYADDLILPRMEDGNGFGAGRKPPGGYLLRCDLDGKNAELFASGQRNTYDIAFNPEGELFGFDSDMEWDWGAPWYRPIRVFHAVSGGDTGFREGSAKWPEYYEDSLPAVVNVGLGSPTGVKFGTGAKFPAKYQNALYIMDWSYGRLLAVHLAPKGASYSGGFENFVAPATLKGGPPKSTLNVTDLEIGPDGAMYFTTGGRGTQSGLYRVSYTGTEPTDVSKKAPAIRPELKLRRELEAFHGRRDPKAVAFAWPHLRSKDRFIRYAARIAIESQPVSEWKDKALAEKDATAGLTALMALARLGGKETQTDLLNALKKHPMTSLNEEQQLLKLRVIELSFIRQGRPAPEMAAHAVEKLGPLFPAKSWPLNRELSQILIYLDTPGIVTKTLDQLAKSETQEEQLHYMVALRNAKSGWTLEDRQRYFSWIKNRPATHDGGPTYPRGGNYFVTPSVNHPAAFDQWFADVGLKPGNGASYANFLKNLRKEAVASLSDTERTELAAVITDAPAAAAAPKKEHKFVREWKMTDLTGDLDKATKGRSFASGQEAFAAAQCLACHRLGNEGGATGPDVTAISSRFTRLDVLSSILEPSKVVSEQYQNMTLTMNNGDDVTGRVLEENDQRLVVMINPLTGEKIEIKKSDIKSRQPSKVSPMPEGLVNILTKDEILDLIAYLESGGKSTASAFNRGN